MTSEAIKARIIVDKIIRDLADRRGLSGKWEQIAEDIQQEIRDAWSDIVLTEMKNWP